MTLEKDIEEKFCEYARSKGCYPVKFGDPARRGGPDRMVLCPGGRVLFIEFKKPNETLRSEQLAYASGLADLDFTSVWSAEGGEAEALLDEFLYDL